ncbi:MULTISPECIES: enoyl-CoA hydratase [Bacillus amyloliquefaciens group]|uniref:enoyl-CoA hydratase n=1 Tax=Bacillus amyloliquefaciens group TaxID=1938374 RepID=UPI0005AD550B|nr:MULTISPECIES: enoyl-CoA hydratase [Bacillus amyloliquefaciens group]AJK65602.1 enoyl-CoA hydratase [Bacillus amyloliquefaciens KHG19]AKL76457.1 enoyl-CoA hydratase [Bacillus velezensis]KOC24738.1 enoyl-CoA hydratase [Bacillus velezensis]KOC26971.1 enoyl-CoA hydratase [Bacillus velezensis]MCM3369835.1 enoyl-CoA hydratase [Bacillus velezensis]
MGDCVLYSVCQETIGLITLNRPHAANSLSSDMIDHLQRVIEDIKNSPSIRCVILTGTGNTFCAGADLKERAGMNHEQVKQSVRRIGETAASIEALPQPVIAALNGTAVGGGLELALACDIRIAVSRAGLGLPETGLAIIPGAGGTQRLPRLIGPGAAKELIYTGRRLSAEEGKDMKLIEHVCEAGELMEKAKALAGRIAANGPIAVRQAKSAINKGLETDLNTGLEIERKAYEQVIPTLDREEGLRAFKEKRPPEYKGK